MISSNDTLRPAPPHSNTQEFIPRHRTLEQENKHAVVYCTLLSKFGSESEAAQKQSEDFLRLQTRSMFQRYIRHRVWMKYHLPCMKDKARQVNETYTYRTANCNSSAMNHGAWLSWDLIYAPYIQAKQNSAHANFTLHWSKSMYVFCFKRLLMQCSLTPSHSNRSL